MTRDETLALIVALTAKLHKVKAELTRGFVYPATSGSLTATGGAGTLPAPTGVSWRAIPSPLASIDRSKAFPQYIPDIKKRFLVDPNHLVTSVEVV